MVLSSRHAFTKWSKEMIDLQTKCNVIYKALKQGVTLEIHGNPLSLAAGAKAADVMIAADIVDETTFMQIAANVAIKEAQDD
jgi:hypothetical protein